MPEDLLPLEGEEQHQGGEQGQNGGMAQGREGRVEA